MAKMQTMLHTEIDPSRPVQEVCDVIAAVLQCHPGNEEQILLGLQRAIDEHITQLKGDESDGEQVLQPRRDKADQG